MSKLSQPHLHLDERCRFPFSLDHAFSSSATVQSFSSSITLAFGPCIYTSASFRHSQPAIPHLPPETSSSPASRRLPIEFQALKPRVILNSLLAAENLFWKWDRRVLGETSGSSPPRKSRNTGPRTRGKRRHPSSTTPSPPPLRLPQTPAHQAHPSPGQKAPRARSDPSKSGKKQHFTRG